VKAHLKLTLCRKKQLQWKRKITFVIDLKLVHIAYTCFLINTALRTIVYVRSWNICPFPQRTNRCIKLHLAKKYFSFQFNFQFSFIFFSLTDRWFPLSLKNYTHEKFFCSSESFPHIFFCGALLNVFSMSYKINNLVSKHFALDRWEDKCEKMWSWLLSFTSMSRHYEFLSVCCAIYYS
jgi:hypothetical protein